MKHFESEWMLAEPVTRYIARRGFTRVEAELQFYDSRMDLYGFSRKLGLTLAVELKLSKWRRAIKQALRYQLCADLVYVAVPSETVGLVDLEQLRITGIGLISVTKQRCREILSPVASRYVRPHYRQHYLRHLESSFCGA
jgi:hypothetical protein